jgi:hypothetical protein
MAVKISSNEELYYRMTLELIFKSSDFMRSYNNIASDPDCAPGELELKKIITIYNLLKKLWDEDDEDGVRNYLKLFLQTNEQQMIKIVVIGTLSIDFGETLENVEARGYSDGKYLAYCNQLKFIHDKHELVGITKIK